MSIRFRCNTYIKPSNFFTYISVCRGKMHILTAFLLLVTCDLSISIAIYNRGNGKVQNDFQNGLLFDKIRDWFGNLKNQIHERLFEPTTTSPLLSTEILNLDRSLLQKRFRNHEWLLLNLSNISFDPNEDWGFHIGNWYFIRKGVIDQHELENNSNESDVVVHTIQPKGSTKIQPEETRPTTQDTYSSTTIKISEGKTENSSENSALITDLDDNETDNNFVRRGSAEVLMG